jgi:hypothetical protein
MTWLDKLKLVRRILLSEAGGNEHNPEPSDHDKALIGSLIGLTQAIEEIGRHTKTPLIDEESQPSHMPAASSLSRPVTWLDKVLHLQTLLSREVQDRRNLPDYDESDDDILSWILLTQAVEEIGRHANTPLIDWNAKQHR